MTLNVRYRFVDFGTAFTSDPRPREETTAYDSPATLHSNELATDVGATCWGPNETLTVIDHHFLRDGQFPSASAAVLHKANLIRERFAHQPHPLLWLVTHTQPDFDALCSMYLARWIVEAPDAFTDWQRYGLHPDAWLAAANGRKFDWFHPDVTAVPAEHRWPLLLASYASLLDNSGPITCPRQRALHSVLYAAIQRGRDYLSPTSGAQEFFDEVREALLRAPLNPIRDSVLEGNARFAPELEMLDRAAEAYKRDLQRARKAIVYLPESEAPTPNFFKSPKEIARRLELRQSAEVDAHHLTLADTFRIPTDGIYLRDPECQLFQEWARLDLENSILGAGFEFTTLAASGGIANAALNTTDYCFSIDPERAHGRHLYTVWSRLQTREVESVLKPQENGPGTAPVLHPGGGERSRTMGALRADPWFGGQSPSGTLVRAPHGGTFISRAGMRSDLRDDAVVEAVRTELECSIYSAESLVAGPQVILDDLAATGNAEDLASVECDLSQPLEIPPPRENHLRFARVGLRSDVPITTDGHAGIGLARQIGETLWQVLYPEKPGSMPQDFEQHHLVVTPDSVGVWGDRGIAVAQKNRLVEPNDFTVSQPGNCSARRFCRHGRYGPRHR